MAQRSSARWVVAMAAVGAALLIGLFVHVPLYENDLFFLLRAGEEIVKGHGVQRVDEWSTTALGQPWPNFEWLSSVVFYAWSRLAPDYELLPTLRALLAALLALGAWALTGRRSREEDSSRLEGFILMAVFFMACRSSFQLRADQLASLAFVALLLRLTARVSDLRKALEGLLLIVFWANLHGGTVWLGAGVFSCWLLFCARGLKTGHRWLGGALALGACLATPVGFSSLAVLWQVTAGYDPSIAGNDDYRPFSLALLHPHSHTLRFWWWLLLTFGSFGFYFWCWRRARRLWTPESPHENPYANPKFVAVCGLALSALALGRLRAMGYLALFALPIAGAGVATALAAARERLGSGKARVATGATLFLVWLSPIVGLLGERPRLPAFGAHDALYPVHSVEFLKRERPKGALYNTYDHGGYLVDRLRAYPVAVDSRETIYLDFLKELKDARTHPRKEKYAAFLSRHGFNVLLLPIPEIEVVPGKGYRDTYGSLAPASDWGLVFADNASLVYVRRIPEHRALLEHSEFRLLYHGLPATYAATPIGLDSALTAEYERELDRCIAASPVNAYCLWGKGAFLRKAGDLARAADFLSLALAAAPYDEELERELGELRSELKPTASR